MNRDAGWRDDKVADRIKQEIVMEAVLRVQRCSEIIIMGYILGLCRDDGRENGNYYSGLYGVQGSF